jgi:hypothetical protein
MDDGMRRGLILGLRIGPNGNIPKDNPFIGKGNASFSKLEGEFVQRRAEIPAAVAARD